ncbi:MAG TPA: dethiobiotin synthase [Gammaproteobacteria bacterium]|nr:dethiobiotin synthase [Gammaproteobacteria bacterium]
MRGVFVTGTDTGVGKTHVAVGMLRILAGAGLQVVGMKPVASGSVQTTAGLRNADALALQAASTAARPYEQVNPYVFVPPSAPHLAAEEAGVSIELSRILAAFHRLCSGADAVVVEGVGGWQVPLADGFGVPDLAKALALPVILVVGLRLGCLNHALLSARAIREDGLTLAGWVANGIDPGFERRSGNLATLKRAMHAPLLGDISWQPGIASEGLADRLDAAKIINLWNACPAE